MTRPQRLRWAIFALIDGGEGVPLRSPTTYRNEGDANAAAVSMLRLSRVLKFLGGADAVPTFVRVERVISLEVSEVAEAAPLRGDRR